MDTEILTGTAMEMAITMETIQVMETAKSNLKLPPLPFRRPALNGAGLFLHKKPRTDGFSVRGSFIQPDS